MTLKGILVRENTEIVKRENMLYGQTTKRNEKPVGLALELVRSVNVLLFILHCLLVRLKN